MQSNNTTERLYEAYLLSRRVTTDSRQVSPGCIFFALRGERFDGGAYVASALEQGAALCVTEWRQYADNPRCVVVDDAVAALQQLAAHHRRQLRIPVLAITGTNGKTTTKELVRAVLASRYRTSATTGNLNNHLGVPLTLLSIPADTEMAVVEMGANHPGEIAQLCAIADPDCGLITNVGRAHLAGFGSFEGVVQTKTELYRHLAAKGGLAFVNADDPILTARAGTMRTVAYGSHGSACGSRVDCAPFLKFYFEVGDNVYTVQTHLLGSYNFDNCMAAVGVGLHFGVEPFDIKEAIEAYVPSNQRSEYRETARGNRLYLDCYNANPSSMEAAIDSFSSVFGGQRSELAGASNNPEPRTPSSELQSPNFNLRTPNSELRPPNSEPRGGDRMAIIGGMHELGADERSEHQRLVEQLDRCALDRCLLVGPEFEGLTLPHPMLHMADTEAAAQWLQKNPVSGATILVKGSNTNRLWTLEQWL